MNHQPRDNQQPQFGKRGEYLVLLQFVVLFAFILAPVWGPWTDSQTLTALAPWRWALASAAAGAALAIGGLGLLGIRAYLTPLPYPVAHNRLVRSGVYAVVRHPLYSSQLFAALAWTAFTLSLTHLALLAVGFAFFDYKASKEEAWLTERHPDYPDYARGVRKLIPWVY
jgi:protein-S-isoprenylcysteine O-methyltransferase Ste14